VVRTAASVEDALAVLDRVPIDVMVSDVVITGGTGPDLHRHATRTRPDLRVLFVSGYALDDLDTRGDDPHTAFLPKPFSAASLLTRLRSLLDRS
jgi:two-component system cell cycle sensor histidine kinase/response regulator CckA